MTLTNRTRSALARRLAHLERVRGIVTAGFEVAPPSFCVRRLEVAGLVATALGVPVSPTVLRDVALVAKGLGFVAVRPQQRRLYSCCKFRDEDPIAALERSRRNRADRRNGP